MNPTMVSKKTQLQSLVNFNLKDLKQGIVNLSTVCNLVQACHIWLLFSYY